MSFHDIKVVLYKGNSYPRNLSLNIGFIYRIIFFFSFLAIAVVFLSGLSIKFFLASRGKITQPLGDARQEVSESVGPFNSVEEQLKYLKDQIDQKDTQIKNLNIIQASPKEIDTQNPVLALFSPAVTDHTKTQDSVSAKNFSYVPGHSKEPATFNFELHNSHPSSSIEKGYIVVLARTKSAIKTYPNVFTTKGPYLLDFEKGESFQVARFRLVNAQFDVSDTKENITHFQVLIFKRSGELLINLLNEVTAQ